MPYSIELGLRTPPPPNAASPHLLRNNVYRWLRLADEALANQLHTQADGEKPFKVSTLIEHAGGASFRITVLDDELYLLLKQGFDKEPWLALHDRHYHFDSEGIDVIGDSYMHMAARAGAQARLTLDFLTPTAFHVAGHAYLLPDPRRTYEGYARRWNAYAPTPLHIEPEWLDWVAASVVVSWLRIESRRLTFETHVQIGFVGQVEFSALLAINDASAHPLHYLALFNCLSDFAFFCGTGHKTTQGMGQTRRIPN